MESHSDTLQVDVISTRAQLTATEARLKIAQRRITDFETEVTGLRVDISKRVHYASQEAVHEYALLGIDPRNAFRGLTEDQIQRVLLGAYRAYSFIYHPDNGGNDKAMKDLNTAYNILREPRVRPPYVC